MLEHFLLSGWEQTGFDDSAWTALSYYGQHRYSVAWQTLTPSLSFVAQRLWLSNVYWVGTIYCRFKLSETKIFFQVVSKLVQSVNIFYENFLASFPVDEEVRDSCDHWQLLSYGFNIASAQFGGYMKDVVNDIVYETDYPYDSIHYADRGFNVIRFRRAWSGCRRSRKLVFDTSAVARPDSSHLNNYLRDHVFPGDVIIAVAIDEASNNIGPVVDTLQTDFHVDVSSLGNR